MELHWELRCRKSATKDKSPPTVRSRSYVGKSRRNSLEASKIRDMNTEEILPKIIRVEERNWFSCSGNWAYSNGVWTVQTRTSSTSRRIGRSRTSTSCYVVSEVFRSWTDWRKQEFRLEELSIRTLVEIHFKYVESVRSGHLFQRSNSTSVYFFVN